MRSTSKKKEKTEFTCESCGEDTRENGNGGTYIDSKGSKLCSICFKKRNQ